MTPKLRNLRARLRSAEHSYTSCRLNSSVPPSWVERNRREIERLESLINQEKARQKAEEQAQAQD